MATPARLHWADHLFQNRPTVWNLLREDWPAFTAVLAHKTWAASAVMTVKHLRRFFLYSLSGIPLI